MLDPFTLNPQEHLNAGHRLIGIQQSASHQNLLGSGAALPHSASNTKASRRESTRSSEGCSTSENPLAARLENNPKLSQEGIITLSANQTRFWQDQGSASHANSVHESFSQIPQLSLDSTRQTGSITSCKDLRQKMALRKYKMSGYLVKYVGNTEYSTGQLREQSEPDDQTQFMVAATYDDAWALVIKRNSEQTLTISPGAVSKRTIQEGEIAMVEVLYDETLLRFLPLCSVDAMDEYKYFKQGRLLVGERKMCTQEGKIRPPIRRHTIALEAEAKDSGLIQIPQSVFDYFKRRCERPIHTRRLPGDLLFLHQRPARPSAREVPIKSSNAKTHQETDEGEARLQKLPGWSPLFTQWSNMTPEQIAQSEPYNADSNPDPDSRSRQPMEHEDYLSQQVVAAETFRQKKAQSHREDGRRRVDVEADVPQTLPIGKRERQENETSVDPATPYDAHRTQPSTHLQSSAHIQDALPTVAEPPVIRFSNNETAVHAPAVRPNPYSFPTTSSTAIEPQANGHRHLSQPQDNIDIRPDDAISKKGQGHPEKVKENKPFRMQSLTKSIGRGLGKVKSRLSIKSGRSQSPGPVSLQMAPRVKPVGFPTSLGSVSEEVDV